MSVEWVTLTGGYRQVMHFCLLSPCNCDGMRSEANVPRHASPMSADAWATAWQQRVSLTQRPPASPAPDPYAAWLA